MIEFLIFVIVAYGLWKLFSDNGNIDKSSEQQKRENNSTIVKPQSDSVGTVNTIKPQGNSVDTITPIKPRGNSDIIENIETKVHETTVKTKEYFPVGKTGYDGLTDNKISKRNNTIAEQISYLEKRYAGKVFEAKSIQKIEKNEIHCPVCGDILFQHDAVLSTGRYRVYNNASCCDACLNAFVKIPKKQKVDFCLFNNILYINKRIFDCQKNHHLVDSATGIVQRLDGSALEINVEYCYTCKKFFIEEIQFERYRKIYGVILGNFIYNDGSEGYFSLRNEHSLLNLCGYNVGQKENLSAIARQKILREVIELGLMSKSEVIKYLDHYINLDRRQSSKRLAVEKWSKDLDFVNSYRLSSQRKVDFR